MRYQITSAGRYDGPEFTTLEEARAELNRWKKEDVRACKARFGQAKLEAFQDGNGYRVVVGINLWSSSSISRL